MILLCSWWRNLLDIPLNEIVSCDGDPLTKQVKYNVCLLVDRQLPYLLSLDSCFAAADKLACSEDDDADEDDDSLLTLTIESVNLPC